MSKYVVGFLDSSPGNGLVVTYRSSRSRESHRAAKTRRTSGQSALVTLKTSAGGGAFSDYGEKVFRDYWANYTSGQGSHLRDRRGVLEMEGATYSPMMSNSFVAVLASA